MVDLFFIMVFPEIIVWDGINVFNELYILIIDIDLVLSNTSIPLTNFIPLPKGVIIFIPVFDNSLLLTKLNALPVFIFFEIKKKINKKKK